MTGVSVAICCHNSAARLLQVLSHLVQQQVPLDLPWEVLLIDNASSDDTAQTALKHWPTEMGIPLRVIHEPTLGLSFARRRAFEESRYAIVSFIDDDNWVAPNWVETVSRVMTERPQVGLLGGPSEAVFESTPPDWFAQHAKSFAVGEQSTERGECTHLWGAGLSIRKAAWEQVRTAGFEPVLSGHTGRELTSGEDSELGLAIALVGWKRFYEPDLRLQHFMPQDRLRWSHFRALYRGFGAAHVYLPIYTGWHEENIHARNARRSWISRMILAIRDLYGKRRRLIRGLATFPEGDSEVLLAEWSIGYAKTLAREWRNYRRTVARIRALCGALAKHR